MSIEVNGITTRFPSTGSGQPAVVALDDVSLSIKTGQLTALQCAMDAQQAHRSDGGRDRDPDAERFPEKQKVHGEIKGTGAIANMVPRIDAGRRLVRELNVAWRLE